MSEINVILIEDDPDLRESLVNIFELSGFYVDAVSCAIDFYKTLNVIRYDVAIIDIGLPDQSGLRIVEFLREKTGLGIIILTAFSTISDRVVGYESGADHYFSKPVNSFELIAAIKSLHSRMAGQLPLINNEEYWRLEKSSWKLVCPEGKSIKLTAKEMGFLSPLMQQPSDTISRITLMHELNYPNDEYGSRSMDSLLRRLRKKVADEMQKELPVQTIRSTGYCFSASAIIMSGG